MKITFIRHGKTAGNLIGRYIGTTDEPLCEIGVKELLDRKEKFSFIKPDRLFVTTKLRTVQTAKLLFPDVERTVVPGLSECDFGMFENKNYNELDGCKEYQDWIDSGGTLPFPGGESREAFIQRCCTSFLQCVKAAMQQPLQELVFVVHGGTIMAILDRYAISDKTYYDWQVKNGEGFSLETNDERMEEGSPFLINIRRIL